MTNVILFFTDQQRWDCSGLHGNPLDLMPNFDRLAHSGTHLFNHVTCAPVCGPARSCLQTGTYLSTNGAFQNNIPLPGHLPTLAECFNEAGYHTGYIGKWHLAGPDGRADPDNRRGPVKESHRGGYKEWLATETLEFSKHEYHTVLYDQENQPVRLPGYRSDALTDASIRFIDRHRDKPFFLMTSCCEPHHQNDKDDYAPPDGYRERYTGRWTPPDLAALSAFSGYGLQGGTAQAHLGGYFGMVKRLDEALGRIYDALKSLDLLENTILVFTSDHGCHFKTRNREYKRSCHESSIRVPAMLHGGPFTDGRCLRQPTNLVDIPPTLLDACGIDVPESMEGRSIMPLMRGQSEDWPEESLIQVCDEYPGRAVRTSRWKYCVMSDRLASDVGMDFDGATYDEAYLYDLQSDPYELTNLIDNDAYTAVRERMRDRLVRRMKEIGEAEPNIQPVEPQRSGQHSLHPGEADQ